MLRLGGRHSVAIVAAALLCAASPLAIGVARADTLESALALAYQNNPSLNAQRAGVRATDENVPQALAGYRPKVSITATGGEQSLSSTTKSAATGGGSTWATSSEWVSRLRAKSRPAAGLSTCVFAASLRSALECRSRARSRAKSLRLLECSSGNHLATSRSP